MCDHNCVHRVGGTQSTRYSTAKTVSNDQKCISWGCESYMVQNSPNGTDPLVTFLRFNLLNELYKLRFMVKAKCAHGEGSPASWTLGSTTDGRDAIILGMEGMNFMKNFISLSRDILTPARSGNRGSRVFASAGGFPEQSRTSISTNHQRQSSKCETHR